MQCNACVMSFLQGSASCIQQAGSCLSHMHAWQRPKQSDGVESGEEAPANLDLWSFFISALPEWSEIPLAENRKRWEKTENCWSIIFGEEWIY